MAIEAFHRSKGPVVQAAGLFVLDRGSWNSSSVKSAFEAALSREFPGNPVATTVSPQGGVWFRTMGHLVYTNKGDPYGKVNENLH